MAVCAGLTLAAMPRLVAHAHEPASAATNDRKWRIRLPGSARVYLFGILAFAAFTAEGSVIDWSAIYLRKELAADVEWSGFAFAGFSLSMMIARFGGDYLRNRFGATRLLQVSALMALAGFLAAGTGAALPLAVAGFLALASAVNIGQWLFPGRRMSKASGPQRESPSPPLAAISAC